jgi:mono/diheme cytochrome c family protein
MRRAFLLLLLALFARATTSAAAVKVTKGEWLRDVPTQDRTRPNPLAANTDAVAAGEHIFQLNCASCHSKDASGHGRRPSLRTERVHDATDGELHWLLTNGVLSRGMPSWSKLPDAQRWQLIRYLHSLPLNAPAGVANGAH